MTEDTLSVYILRATKDLFIISIQEPMTLAGVRGFETPGHAYFIEGIFLSLLLLVLVLILGLKLLSYLGYPAKGLYKK